MPKVPDGEMTRAELVRLVKKYNEKMGIDPKGKSRDQLIKEIESLKYKIDHVKKDLVLQVNQKVKKQPRNVKADPIKQKTKLQKQKAAEKKEEKEMEKKKELRKVKKEVADKIINREKRVKDKASKNSTTKMKGKEDQIVEFYGKSDKKFKDPPVTKQPEKKVEKKENKEPNDIELVKMFKKDFMHKMRGAAGGDGLSFRTNKPLTKVRINAINKLIEDGGQPGDDTEMEGKRVYNMFNIKYHGDSDFGFVRLVLEKLYGAVPQWFEKMKKNEKERIYDLFYISLSPNKEDYADRYAYTGQPKNVEAMQRYQSLDVLRKKKLVK